MEQTVTYFEDLQARAKKVWQTIENETNGLSLAILNGKPTPQDWSILECVEHLNLFANYFHQAIENALHKLARQASAPPCRYTWLGRQAIKAVNPENSRKVKTAKSMRPVDSTLNVYVLEQFQQHQNDLIRLLEDSIQKNINKGGVPIPFFKLLSLNLTDSFQFLVTHQERHLNQILRTKKVVMEKKG